MLKRLTITAACMLITACGTMGITDDPLSIKGYAPGQPITACPQGWHTSKKGPELMCIDTAATLAGEPVKSMGIYAYDGTVTMVSVELTPGHAASQSHMLRALTDKHGTPARAAYRRTLWLWVHGTQQMTLDEIKSEIVLVDTRLNSQAQKSQLKAGAHDL